LGQERGLRDAVPPPLGAQTFRVVRRGRVVREVPHTLEERDQGGVDHLPPIVPDGTGPRPPLPLVSTVARPHHVRMQLIVLHGPAAAGKLTTARALERRLGYPVFHNHLVVDTLTTMFPFGSEPFVRLREQFWLDVFEEAARTGRSLLFTFAPEATVRPGFPARVRETVERHGGSVRFVRLAVS